MLVEVCFVDTDDADKYLKLGADKLATAICEAITGTNAPAVMQTTEEYTSTNDIIWDLHHRGIITDAALWTAYMKRDTNVYWLLRKGLHWCRTH